MSYTIIKCDHAHLEKIRYVGEVQERGADWVCVVAPFTMRTRDLGYVVIETGDIFTEWFYSGRWYNIFRINHPQTGALKGYYCNLTRPAQLFEDYLTHDDLALDVWVSPTGQWQLLDEQEYKALPIAASEREQVEWALADLQQLIQGRSQPFTALP